MSKMTIKLREATQFATDPESDKFEKDVVALLRRRYIKNFSKWLAKRGKVVTDKDGNHFVNMLATYYDEERSVSKTAGLLNDWIMANDSASFADDPSDAGFYLDRKVFTDGKPSEAKDQYGHEILTKETIIKHLQELEDAFWNVRGDMLDFSDEQLYDDYEQKVYNAGIPELEKLYNESWAQRSFDELSVPLWCDKMIEIIEKEL